MPENKKTKTPGRMEQGKKKQPEVDGLASTTTMAEETRKPPIKVNQKVAKTPCSLKKAKTKPLVVVKVKKGSDLTENRVKVEGGQSKPLIQADAVNNVTPIKVGEDQKIRAQVKVNRRKKTGKGIQVKTDEKKEKPCLEIAEPRPVRIIGDDRDQPFQPYLKDELYLTREIPRYKIPDEVKLLAQVDFKKRPDDHKLTNASLKAFTKRLRIGRGARRLRKHLDYLRCLIHVDMINEKRSVREYWMKNIKFYPSPSFQRRYNIELPTSLFGERSPIAYGGVIIAVVPGEDCGYFGKIKEIYPGANKVAVAFCKEFAAIYESHAHADHRFEVRIWASFFVSSSQLRALDELDSMPIMSAFIFPNGGNCSISRKCFEALKPLVYSPPSNDQIKTELNIAQLGAVQAILTGHHAPCPFILFGPPGTGKTTTLIETMRVLLSTSSKCRLLVCAPSNSAADVVAERLLAVTKLLKATEIFRMNAASRKIEKTPQELLKICFITRSKEPPYDRRFGLHSMDYLRKCRVIVCTLSMVSYLVSANVDRGFFTHVFIDEAGQATEPLALIPIAGLCCYDRKNPTLTTRVILSGDPKQLGPTVTAQFAMKLGLGRSMLERLMEISCYKKQMDGKYDSRVMCMLTDNHRSHPKLIRIPSDLFYDAGLLAKADKKERESLCHWPGLHKRGFPMEFHASSGTEKQGTGGKSFHNREEIATTDVYVKKLVQFGIKAVDIGIITPYRAQVEALQDRLKSSYPDMTIDTVEKFQGSERRVIIISTVRTKAMGFVNDKQRFNTALTRAKQLTIVIGDEKLLRTDGNWKKLLDYIKQESRQGNEEKLETALQGLRLL